MIKKIKFLKSKNIFLRPFLKKDLSASYLKWINNRDKNMFLETTRFPSSDRDLELFYKKNFSSKNSVLFAICNNNGKHIGNCSISQIDWINRRCVYGRMLGETNKLKKGSGSEVLKLMQYYIFEVLNLNSMWTGVCADNIASVKSNIKCNMRKVGIFKDAFYTHNKYSNVVIFEMTKNAYKRMNEK